MSESTLTSEDERFGLALRFDVVIDGHDLGGWQQCSGLEVSFDPEEVKEMGENTSLHHLRGPAKYPPITLTRAMEKGRWLDTRQWLSDLQNSQARQSAVITLRNAWGEEVASWSLQNVIPTKWQGPSLDATQSHVATEKLTLAHEGFEHLAGHDTVTRAKLYDSSGQTLYLQFNPQSMQKMQVRALGGNGAYHRRAGSSQAGKAAQSQGASPSNAGRMYGSGRLFPCRYKLNKVVFDSYYQPDPQARPIAELIDLLFYWMEPNNATNKPLPLHFVWRNLHKESVLCSLSTSSVTYDRLEPDGTPSRATVDITLDEQPEEQPGTNPTSGGPGGHRSRVLVADESLAAVAYQEYGNAGEWPLLAKFNGIDDPTRIRPGTAIQVPPATVLTRR